MKDDELLSVAPRHEVTRRDLLKLLGGGVAALGAGCLTRAGEEEIVPYVVEPEKRPGTPVRYASVLVLDGFGTGIVVETRDGRPIKIEGNPLHPATRGASNAFAQAAILELYDPDRSRLPMHAQDKRREPRTWDEFLTFAAPHFAGLKNGGGAGLRVLCEASDSPTHAAAKADFAKAFPQARWYEYEPVSRDNERLGGSAQKLCARERIRAGAVRHQRAWTDELRRRSCHDERGYRAQLVGSLTGVSTHAARLARQRRLTQQPRRPHSERPRT